jgi:hypothetical protein
MHIKNTSKLFQTGAECIKTFDGHIRCTQEAMDASSGIGSALNAAKYQKNICNK